MEGSNDSGAILKGTFYLFPSTTHRVIATLDSSRIELISVPRRGKAPGQVQGEILLKDVIGCVCMKQREKRTDSWHRLKVFQNGQRIHPEKDKHKGFGGDHTELDCDKSGNDVMSAQNGTSKHCNSAFLSICSYRLKKKKLSGALTRCRNSIILSVSDLNNFEENLRLARKWQSAILCFIRKFNLPVSTMLSPESTFRKLATCKKYLVLLNPKSGSGKACNIFLDKVSKVMKEGGCGFDIVITKHAGHARNIIKNAHLSNWSGIVVVSGDGLLYEVYNGLFDRRDRSDVLTTPVGIIPGGSGNGLARSIAHYNGEPYLDNPVLVSTLNVVSRNVKPMDLVLVHNEQQTICSFLSVGWGLLADIDIESERLRVIGGQRFLVYAFARILNLRTYRGRISFLPASNVSPNSTRSNGAGLTTTSASKNPSHSSCMRVLCGRPNLEAVATSPVPDSLGDMDGCDKSECYASNLTISGCENVNGSVDIPGNLNDLQLGSYHNAITSENLANGNGERSSFREVVSSLEDSFPIILPPLGNEVPDSWTTIDGEFVAVYATYQSHIGSDAFFAPSATLDDGVIWLVYIKSGISKSRLLQFLLSIESGAHINMPEVIEVPVSAFRIEPDITQKDQGHIVVDGELVDYLPIQAQVLPSAARIMSR